MPPARQSRPALRRSFQTPAFQCRALPYGTTITAEPQTGGRVAPRRCVPRARRTSGESMPPKNEFAAIPLPTYARESRPGGAVPSAAHGVGGSRPSDGNVATCGSGRPLRRRRQERETPQSALLESQESTFHSGRRRLVGALMDRPDAIRAALRNCRHKPCPRCGCLGAALTPTQSVKSQGRLCGGEKACGLSQ